jgi:Leucine-rich repeat (LRR) protein
MTSLRALNVRRNLLVELPKEIAQLKLVNFDCSSNRLSKLPLCFREMISLIDLVVDHNPLEVPPAHVILIKSSINIFMKFLLNYLKL